MPVWTWVALGLFLGLTVPAGLLGVAATIAVFRRLHRLGMTLEQGAYELEVRAERLAGGAEAAAGAAARAQASVRTLRASRERLGVLLWALEDVRRLVRLARSLSPQK